MPGYVNGAAGPSVAAPGPVATASTQPQHNTGNRIIPIQFRKAVKYAARGRAALIGPPGSGKSLTMLKLARALAGPTGKIACIDTEHGSLSKYADLFDFDVFELDSFSPDNFLSALRAAEEAKYAVFGCDSLSHFWQGKDGALDFADNALTVARSRSRGARVDDQTGWKEFAPHEREMVDAMTGSSCHVIVTMRTKTAYEEQVGNDGKRRRVKVGLAPVQRQGLEYEFDLVGYMDEDNTLVVDKTRVMLPDGSAPYTGKAFTKPGAREFQAYVDWLAGGAQRPVAPPPPSAWSLNQQTLDLFEGLKRRVGAQLYTRTLATYGVRDPKEFTTREVAAAAYKELSNVAALCADAATIDTGGHPVGTQAAADYVAQQKIRQFQAADPNHPPSYIEDLPEWPAGTTDPWVKAKGVLYYRLEDGNYARFTAPAPAAQPGSSQPPNPPAAPEPDPELPQKRGDMARAFAEVRERIGEMRYLEELALAGVSDPLKFRDRTKANECYRRMVAIARLQKEAA